MKRDLKFEVEYPHPPERVWRALTDSGAITEWLMTNNFEPRVGHRFQFRAKPMPGWNGIVDCQVRELDPPRRLSYTWKSNAIDTVVVWTLTPTAAGTNVRLEHSGFEGIKAVLVSMMMKSGWGGDILNKYLPLVLANMAQQGQAWRSSGVSMHGNSPK
ncbi:MAG TPA: SRPBCC domain-containing protein [Terriglobales bacterium]|nr:SRPBCC domain-containing protein [Terriglobales bacterium]